MRKDMRLTAAVAALLSDNAVLAEFRRNPARALRRYRLSEHQLRAVQSGDLDTLAASGLDTAALYETPKGARSILASLARRGAWLTPLLLACGLWASPVATAAPTNGRRSRFALRGRAGVARGSGPFARVRAGQRAFRVGGKPSGKRVLAVRARAVIRAFEPGPAPGALPVVRGRVTIRARAAGQRFARTVYLPREGPQPDPQSLPIDLRTGKTL